MNLAKSPQQALLGKPVEGILGHVRRLMAFIFTAARLSIARSWRLPIIPFDLLKAKLTLIMINERMVAIHRDKLARFKKTWNPWIKYLSEST